MNEKNENKSLNKLNEFLYSIKDFVSEKRNEIVSGITSFALLSMATCTPAIPTPTPTTTQPTTTISVKTPVQDYAKNLGIPSNLIPILVPLDQDEKMSNEEKSYVDALSKNDATVLKSYQDITNNLFEYQKNIIIKADPIGKDIVDEFSLIPDLNVIEVMDVEAVKDIYNQLLEAKATNSYNAFTDSLNAGVKGKKKGSTFEAWLLIYQEKNPEQFNIVKKYVENNSLFVIYNEAWRNISSSNYVKGEGYKSDRWKDFNLVTNRMIDPFAVSTYMLDNIKYDREKENKIKAGIYVPEMDPEETWNYRKGVCHDLSRLANRFLVIGAGYFSGEPRNNDDKASFVLDVIDTSITSGSNGHTVCGFTGDGLFEKLHDGYLRSDKYSTFEELVKSVFRGNKYIIRDYDDNEIRIGYLNQK